MNFVPDYKLHNLAILIARVLLMLLMVIFGAEKLLAFSGTVDYMKACNLPMPELAAVIAVLAELGGGVLLILGFKTRPLACLMAIYVLATALVGHAFWNMAGAERVGAEINFYKNVSIMGGLVLLMVTGAGQYSIDHLLRRR